MPARCVRYCAFLSRLEGPRRQGEWRSLASGQLEQPDKVYRDLLDISGCSACFILTGSYWPGNGHAVASRLMADGATATAAKEAAREMNVLPIDHFPGKRNKQQEVNSFDTAADNYQTILSNEIRHIRLNLGLLLPTSAFDVYNRCSTIPLLDPIVKEL